MKLIYIKFQFAKSSLATKTVPRKALQLTVASLIFVLNINVNSFTKISNAMLWLKPSSKIFRSMWCTGWCAKMAVTRCSMVNNALLASVSTSMEIFTRWSLFFHNLTREEQDQILDYELMIYFCDGTDKERLDWFRIINIAGEKLTDQELRNAVYTGSWLSDAKLKFSKSNCAAYLLANDGGQLISGSRFGKSISRLHFRGSTMKDEDYMAKHQHDKSAEKLWEYFRA